MSIATAHKAPTSHAAITWTHIPLVPQVALVGDRDGLPVAVIDQVGSAGFRASLCNGTEIGVFRTLDEGKRAVAAALDGPELRESRPTPTD